MSFSELYASLHSVVPNEIILYVLSYLDHRSLCSIQRVHPSWSLSTLSTNDCLWSNIYNQLLSNFQTRVSRKLYLRDGDPQDVLERDDGFPRGGPDKGKVRFLCLFLAEALLVNFNCLGAIDSCFVGTSHQLSLLDDWIHGEILVPNEVPDEIDSTRSFHIVGAGDGCVGKSSLLYAILGNGFTREYMPCFVECVDEPVSFHSRTFHVSLSDTAGDEDFGIFDRHLETEGGSGVDCFLLCFDVRDTVSFQNVEHWFDVTHRLFPNASFVLCGNKSDLRKGLPEGEAGEMEDDGERDSPYVPHPRGEVSRRQAVRFARDRGIAFYVETSAKLASRSSVGNVLPTAITASIMSRLGFDSKALLTNNRFKCIVS